MKNDQDIFKTIEKHGSVISAMSYHAKELDKVLSSEQAAGAYVHIEALHNLLEYARSTGKE